MKPYKHTAIVLVQVMIYWVHSEYIKVKLNGFFSCEEVYLKKSQDHFKWGQRSSYVL